MMHTINNVGVRGARFLLLQQTARKQFGTSGAAATPSIVCRAANLSDPSDAATIVQLLDAYGLDPMGGGEALSDEVKGKLVPSLIAHGKTRAFLASQGAKAVGLAICFESFSSFECKRVLNIHDFATLPGRQRVHSRYLYLHSTL